MKIKGGVFVAVTFSLILLIAGVAVGVGAQISSQACEEKAAKGAMAYTWDLGVGCYIEIAPGKWVSAEDM